MSFTMINHHDHRWAACHQHKLSQKRRRKQHSFNDTAPVSNKQGFQITERERKREAGQPPRCALAIRSSSSSGERARKNSRSPPNNKEEREREGERERGGKKKGWPLNLPSTGQASFDHRAYKFRLAISL